MERSVKLNNLQKVIILIGCFLGIDLFVKTTVTGVLKYFLLSLLMICTNSIGLISTYIVIQHTIIGALLTIALWIILLYTIRHLAGADSLREIIGN